MVIASDEIDPQILRFADALSEGYRAFPDFDTLPPEVARRVAEIVRKPWRSGGPVMAETTEYFLPGPHGQLRIRTYRPSQKTDLPALLYLHGGGWTIFSLDTHDRIMRELAARSGMAIIGVDYALSPEAKFPVALEQITSCVLWLSEHGRTIDINPAALMLGGDSVGGNLSVAAALSLRDTNHADILRGLLLLYGVYDKNISTQSVRRFGHTPYTLNAAEMDSFWQNYLSAPKDLQNPLVRPILADLSGLPPVHMSFGACDILAEQNMAMAEKLKSSGVDVQDIAWPGATHSFLEAVSVSDVADRALDICATWMKKIRI